ncbi:hypothetical protein LCW_09545 [Latilactobacillus curvatus]|uniref:RNA-directed DNA polymerase n=1 Tax=Latilactobacillus curvatus TaxID=28038 RepID=UPI00084A18CE|nr:RNA-directed DNA polymerase [Latilactobacillus curvatus]AOO76228.1 hypothetical protein LCW_09545 [Latilactobacillus curvatus]
MRSSRKKIIDMSSVEARRFLLKPNSYVTLQLPEYLDFHFVLENARKMLDGQQIESIIDIKKLRETDGVNHTILLNKDGSYDWRPVQIVHPLLYVDLVYFITNPKNWRSLLDRFELFRSDNNIECISLPVESTSDKTDTAEVILNWWEGLEQSSVVKALHFSYCIKTDITNCYGSIYTHTLDWAIRDKVTAKTNRRGRSFGEKLDKKIRQLQHNQTNGIPQGGVLFDFIAEIILGYADLLLSERLKNLELSEWHIIRYRDDYRVFSNKKEEAESIIKELSEVLSELNMHFNSKKTSMTQDIIENAIKPDKRYWNGKVPTLQVEFHKEISYQLTLQKHLLEILWLSKKYPNSGSIKRALTDFSKRLDSIEKIEHDTLPLISILTDIVSNNPNTIPIGIAVMSRVLSKGELINIDGEIEEIVQRISRKLEGTPNMNFLQIWLQRLSLTSNSEVKYQEKICKTVMDSEYSIWNSSWVKGDYKLPSIVREDKLDLLMIEVPNEVFNVFSEYSE